VLVGGEEDSIAVAAMIGKVGQGAQAQQVRGGVERQPIFRSEALPCHHLLGNGPQKRITEARQVEPTSHRISLAYTR
jgi:hypothetical protein